MRKLPMLGSRLFLLLLATAIAYPSPDAGAASIYIKDFGAAGDGKTDDGEAIRKAVDAAIHNGPGTRLVFEQRTYRFGPHRGDGSLIELVDIDGLTIEGKGATLILHPQNGFLSVRRCRDVVIRGFVLDFDPLPFTQGTIRAVRAEEGVFDLELHEGYPLPPPDAVVKQRIGRDGWRWGSVIDPVKRHRRWGIADHYRIASVDAIKGRLYRIKVIPTHAERLDPVSPGDRFFLPFMLTEKGERAFGENIAVRESSNCLLENITIYSARSGMNYSISRNEGLITLRNSKITFKPGSDRICTTWKDGMHVKDNRVGPLIEGCSFEGMLDDSINISANTAMATKIITPTEFQLIGPPFSASDEVMVFKPQTGETRMTQVVKATAHGRDYIVTLAEPIPNVVTGSKQREHIKSTHFYNMSYVNNGYIVRNCIFKPQRRHALLVRCSNGVFEGNEVDGVGGAAVWMGNEMGSFYEGPFPQNNIIRGNKIRNTQQTAIHVYTQTLGGNAKLTSDIRVEGNTISVLPGQRGISVQNAVRVERKSNIILDQTGKELGDAGVSLNDRE